MAGKGDHACGCACRGSGRQVRSQRRGSPDGMEGTVYKRQMEGPGIWHHEKGEETGHQDTPLGLTRTTHTVCGRQLQVHLSVPASYSAGERRRHQHRHQHLRPTSGGGFGLFSLPYPSRLLDSFRGHMSCQLALSLSFESGDLRTHSLACLSHCITFFCSTCIHYHTACRTLRHRTLAYNGALRAVLAAALSICPGSHACTRRSVL